jgi:hypothetical protein
MFQCSVIGLLEWTSPAVHLGHPIEPFAPGRAVSLRGPKPDARSFR